MAVTIRDVARKAGVSISTVSAVVNGTKYVSPDLRAKVEQAVAELGYIPSLLGRALSSKRSSMLAYVIPTITNPFFATMIQTVQSLVVGRGFGLIVCSSEEEQVKAKQHESFLIGAHVDGVVLSPLSTQSLESQCRPFIERGIPVVVLAGSRHLSDCDCVILDDAAGMKRVTQHLIALGHTRFAYVGKKNSHSSRLRLETVRSTLAESGLELSPDYTAEVAQYNKLLPPTESYHQAQSLLSRPSPPTAVLCHNDAVAVGVMQACYDLGLKVPHDISVTGFDDTLAHVTSPPLTTLRVPVEEMARLATQLLLARLIGSGERQPHIGGPATVHRFEAELVARPSTSTPRV